MLLHYYHEVDGHLVPLVPTFYLGGSVGVWIDLDAPQGR